MKCGIERIKDILPNELVQACEKWPQVEKELTEVHFRINQPIICIGNNQEYIVKDDGSFVKYDRDQAAECCVATKEVIERFLLLATQHSLYAYQTQISEGYICLPGGNRLGILGDAVWDINQKCQFRKISFLALRLSHDVLNCSEKLLREINLMQDRMWRNTLLISPPGMGKTTMLRDMARHISEAGRKVVIIDERGELAACYEGIPQLEVGCRTSVLTGCRKDVGMEMAVRSMSPEWMVVDEIGSDLELNALAFALHSGCGVLCSMHGKDMEDVWRRGIMKNEEIFHNIVLLTKEKGVYGYKILKKAREKL